MDKAEYLDILNSLKAQLKIEHEERLLKASSSTSPAQQNQSLQYESAAAISSAPDSTKTDVAFLNKYGVFIKELREEADKNTAAALAEQESRLRAHYTGIIDHLEGELRRALAIRETADALWLGDLSKRDKSQTYLLHYVEEKCRDAYSVSQNEYDKRLQEFSAKYDQMLEESERNCAKQRQKYDVKISGLVRAVKNWKVDYQHTLHNKYTELQCEYENSFNRKLEALQKELNKVSLEKFAISQTQLASPITGLSAGQIQILRYQFDLLKLDPLERNKILLDILGNIYSVTTHIDLLSANIKKMAEVQQPEARSNASLDDSNSYEASNEFDSIAVMSASCLSALQEELDKDHLSFEKTLGSYLSKELQSLNARLLEIDNL